MYIYNNCRDLESFADGKISDILRYINNNNYYMALVETSEMMGTLTTCNVYCGEWDDKDFIYKEKSRIHTEAKNNAQAIWDKAQNENISEVVRVLPLYNDFMSKQSDNSKYMDVTMFLDLDRIEKEKENLTSSISYQGQSGFSDNDGNIHRAVLDDINATIGGTVESVKVDDVLGEEVVPMFEITPDDTPNPLQEEIDKLGEELGLITQEEKKDEKEVPAEDLTPQEVTQEMSPLYEKPKEVVDYRTEDEKVFDNPECISSHLQHKYNRNDSMKYSPLSLKYYLGEDPAKYNQWCGRLDDSASFYNGTANYDFFRNFFDADLDVDGFPFVVAPDGCMYSLYHDILTQVNVAKIANGFEIRVPARTGNVFYPDGSFQSRLGGERIPCNEVVQQWIEKAKENDFKTFDFGLAAYNCESGILPWLFNSSKNMLTDSQSIPTYQLMNKLFLQKATTNDVVNPDLTCEEGNGVLLVTPSRKTEAGVQSWGDIPHNCRFLYNSITKDRYFFYYGQLLLGYPSSKENEYMTPNKDFKILYDWNEGVCKLVQKRGAVKEQPQQKPESNLATLQESRPQVTIHVQDDKIDMSNMSSVEKKALKALGYSDSSRQNNIGDPNSNIGIALNTVYNIGEIIKMKADLFFKKLKDKKNR